MSEPWLLTLVTPTQAGWDLAVKLSRMGVKGTQPSDEIREKLRTIYEDDADSLIATSQVVAFNFQTVAAANDHKSVVAGGVLRLCFAFRCAGPETWRTRETRVPATGTYRAKA